MSTNELPAGACRECTRLQQNVDQTSGIEEGFIKCNRCHFPACHTVDCCGEIQVQPQHEGVIVTELYCAPCFRTWCNEVREKVGESAAASLSVVAQTPASLLGIPSAMRTPAPPPPPRYFFSSILKDGLCLFRALLRFFMKTIQAAASDHIRVTPVMLCEFITYAMMKTDGIYWACLGKEYVDFTPGTTASRACVFVIGVIHNIAGQCHM